MFVPRFSNKGEFSPVFPTGDREIGYEVFIVCSDGVVRGSILHTGVDHAGSVERIVGEKLAVTREIKVPLQPFSFIDQTLHLSMKFILLPQYWIIQNNTWQSSKEYTPALLNSWQEWYFSSSFFIINDQGQTFFYDLVIFD